MKLRLSILNVFAIVFLVSCIGFTVTNYRQLSEGEGWGVVGMVGLVGMGVMLLVVDIALHNIFKNRVTANVIGSVVAIVFTALIAFSDMFS